jgi:hypothetical protein
VVAHAQLLLHHRFEHLVEHLLGLLRLAHALHHLALRARRFGLEALDEHRDLLEVIGGRRRRGAIDELGEHRRERSEERRQLIGHARRGRAVAHLLDEAPHLGLILAPLLHHHLHHAVHPLVGELRLQLALAVATHRGLLIEVRRLGLRLLDLLGRLGVALALERAAAPNRVAAVHDPVAVPAAAAIVGAPDLGVLNGERSAEALDVPGGAHPRVLGRLDAVDEQRGVGLAHDPRGLLRLRHRRIGHAERVRPGVAVGGWFVAEGVGALVLLAHRKGRGHGLQILWVDRRGLVVAVGGGARERGGLLLAHQVAEILGGVLRGRAASCGHARVVNRQQSSRRGESP